MKEYETPQELLEAVHYKLVEMHDEGSLLNFDFDIFIGRGGGHILRPSSAGNCQRQLAYRKLFPEEREDIKARTVGVFMHGDVHHVLERKLIGLVTPITNVEKHVNFFVDNDIGFVPGSMDGQITLDGKPYILDVKSAADYSFKTMERTGPRADHIAQLNCYMEATGVPRAILWAINKNTAHRAAFIVEHDREVVNDVRARFKQVKESIDSGGEFIPPRMYEPVEEIRRGKPTGRLYLDWQCRYCDYTDRCWGEEGFEMVIERGKPRWIKDTREEEE